MKRLLFLLTACIICTCQVWSQNQTILGKVVDASTEEPIIGASVVVAGTTQGTITDVDGAFTIDAAPGTKLIVSFIGLQTKEVAAAQNMVVALREDVELLDEVMVVGYGTATRAQFVGSATAVKGDELTNVAASNITNTLAGKVAGVQVINTSGQPGEGSKIRIRGVGSVNGSTTPLYIVDGAPVDEATMNLISSYDIESMTILKDASSTSIYGARGANGVVLITTKNGSKTSKMSVNVDAKWGTNSREVGNYNMITDPALYYELAYRALYNSQAYNGKDAATAYAYADKTMFTQSGVGYQIYTVPAGQKVIGTNFKLNPNATLGYSDGTYTYTPDDWAKETLSSGALRHEYNLNISGGNQETQYFISGGYLKDPGLIAGSSFERFTANARVTSQVKKWLRVEGSARYAHTDYQNPGYTDDDSWGSTGNVFYTANTMGCIYPFYVRNADGSIKKDALGYTVYDTGTNTNQVRPGNAPQGNNAINLNIDRNNTVTDFFSGNFALTLTPVEGLNIEAKVTPSYSGAYTNELSNPFYGSTSNGGSVYVGSQRIFSINQQYMVNYQKRFADIHNIKVMAGWEAYSLKEQEVYGSNDHLYNPFVAELSNAYGVAPTSANAKSTTDTYARAGALAAVQYDLLDRYFVNATFRYDSSSRFAKKNRWGAFGSIGVGWLLNREKWLADQNWIDELKLRASWGTNGNDQIKNYYAFRNLYSISYNSDTKEYSKTLSSLGNEDLKWESQMQGNLAVEFSFWDRLTGSVEYFNKQNKDQLFMVPNPPSSGYGSLSTPMNIGKTTSQGVEITLDAALVKTPNIEWRVYGNIAWVDNKINELPDYAKETGIVSSAYILKEGGSFNQGYMREYAGVDYATGKALYYIDPEDHSQGTTTSYDAAQQGNIGDLSAKWFGGFGTIFECYGVDLNVQFSYQFGGKAYDGGYQESMHCGDKLGRAWNVDILDAWTPENKDAKQPRICSSDSYDQETSTRWLVSSNFLSLNNLTLGYSLPKNVVKKARLEKVRFYFQGDNLALFAARKGFDPRQIQNAFGVGVGISTNSGNYVYSQSRTLSGGVSITF